jgi:integrase
MASFRRLPSGLWQAEVRLPSGSRTTRSDPLKRVVRDWANDLEAAVARGEWRDPRAARIRWEDWRDQWSAARVVEEATARSDKGVLRKHLTPQWAGWRLGAITRIEVQGWVKRMQAAGEGPHAIRRAHNTLAKMLGDAVREGLIAENPCRDIDLPATPRKAPAWFTPEQVAAIADQLPPRHAAATHLMAWTGLRWGEVAGLRIMDVHFLRRRIQVVGSSTQLGTWKEHPKSAKSRREVPVPAWVLELLAPIAAGRPPTERLFLTERPYKGEHRPWSGANWLVAWKQAIGKAQAAHPELDIPNHPVHALRHSCASWQVQAGTPLYKVQALLGHESSATTARYSHLEPGAHESVEQAWAKLRGGQKKTSP